jgi:peptidoglycan/LPS O-acetylase OafA/YrhL
MQKTTVDKTFSWLLVLGGILHGVGTFKAFDAGTSSFVWSLAGSFAAILLAAINLMRVNRPGDVMLARVCLAGCLCWIAIALMFNQSIHNMLDPRGLYHAIAALVLAWFSFQNLMKAPVTKV